MALALLHHLMFICCVAYSFSSSKEDVTKTMLSGFFWAGKDAQGLKFSIICPPLSFYISSVVPYGIINGNINLNIAVQATS